MNDAQRDAVFAACEAIARDRTEITGRAAYCDGYRAAADDIAKAIRRKRGGEPLTRLERDLRDVEVEARTLGRVVKAASRIAASVDSQASPAEVLRQLLLVFFASEDVPEHLGPPSESAVWLMDAPVDGEMPDGEDARPVRRRA